MIKKICTLVLVISYNTIIIAQNITISGSNTMFPLVKSLFTSYCRSSNQEFKISGEGTGSGIKDFIDKKNNIAMLSRKLHKEEIEALKLKNIDYEIYPLTLDALCIIVNSTTRIHNVSLDDLENIYNGKIKSWLHFGDEDKQIKPLIRDSKSGTADFFKEMVMKNSSIFKDCTQFSNTSSIIYAVSVSNEYIGYVGCAYVDEHTKALDIKTADGQIVEPNEANIKSKKYPLNRELYLMYEKSNKPVTDFITYCKSATGQKLIESNGFLLLNKN